MINLIRTHREMLVAVKDLTKEQRLAHDTETKGLIDKGISGLFPFHGARSFSHIFATKKHEYYFDFNIGGINPKYKYELQPIFDDSKRLMFYVNAIFDNTIMHFDGLKNKTRIMDWASLARVEYNRHGKGDKESYLSLKYLAEYYGVQRKIDKVEEYIKEHDLYAPVPCVITGKKIPLYDKVPLDLMVEYACGDVRSTYDGADKTIRCINFKVDKYKLENPFDKNMRDLAVQESDLMPALIDMKIEGFEIDRDYILKAREHEQTKKDSYDKDLKELVGDVNFNSPAQVGRLLESRGVNVNRKPVTSNALKDIEKLEAKRIDALVRKNTKKAELIQQKILEKEKGNFSLDKKELAKIMEANKHLDFLSLITKSKECGKKINTYYNNFLSLSDERNFLHGEINPNTTVTGRMSASQPNLQNLHKEAWVDDEGNIIGQWNIRNSLTNFDDNFDLFFFDYEQQEMIVMLDQAGELDVINKLKSGEYKDFYLATVAVIKEVTGILITRQQAKAIALGLAYGQGIASLAIKLGISFDEAKYLRDMFFRGLPKLEIFINKLKFQVEMRGKIHNPFGRILYIDANGAYKALNAFVQGTSADITKRALIDIHKFLKTNDKKSKLLLTVHDEIVLKIHKQERSIIPVIQKIMRDSYKHIHIPLSTGVDIGGPSWGQKQEFIYEEAV